MKGEEQHAHGPFPESVRDHAITRLRELLKGNGVSVDKLKFEHLEGGLFPVEGYCRIEIGYSRTQGKSGKKRRKEAYHKVESQEALEDAIETTRRELCEKGDKRKHIVKKLLDTPDQGFNAEGYELDLSDFNCSFVLPRECRNCHHKGKVTCHNCHGNKHIQCQKCHGSTQMPCPQCQGSTFVQGPNGRQPCQQCSGQGHIPCDKCKNAGHEPCPKCGARGAVTCQTCGGSGWHEETTHIAFHATTRLEYNTQNLPRGLLRIMHKQAGKLAADNALQLKAEEDSANKEPNTIYVNYSGDVPYGKLHMRLKGKHLSAHVYGYDARLGDVPPFLEHCCATGIKALQKAADTPGAAMSELKTAARYRLLRQALVLTSQRKPRQAFRHLANQYPHGVRETSLKGLVMKSDQALRNVTRTPRLLGLGTGLCISAAFILFYYLWVHPALPLRQPWQTGLADLALVLLCCSVISLSIHLMAMRELRRIFAYLSTNKGHVNKLQPRLDLSISTGVSAALGLYGLIIAALAALGVTTPDWAATTYAMLRDSLL